MLGQQFFSVEKYSQFVHNHFVPVYAVIEDDFGEALQDKYHINSNPSLLITKSDGSLYDILAGYDGDPDKYLERMQNSVQGIDTYASIKQQYDQNPDDLKRIFALAYKHAEMWQAGKSAELSKKIMERSEEAKTLEVPFKNTDINLYEVAKYNVGMGVYFEERSPEGLEAFRVEFPQSILIDDTYTALTNIYLRLPVTSESNAFFKDVIEKYSDDPPMLDRVVRYFTKTGEDLDRGEKFAKKLIGLEPESSSYRRNATDLFLKNNNKKEALKVYGEDYIEPFMDDPGSLNSYAWFWALKEMNLKSALKTIKKAFDLDPKDDNLLDTMSMVYWKMKEYKMAIETEQKALEMNPNNQGYRDRIEEIKKNMAKKGITKI